MFQHFPILKSQRVGCGDLDGGRANLMFQLRCRIAQNQSAQTARGPRGVSGVHAATAATRRDAQGRSLLFEQLGPY
eukprot:6466955-Amphidinium_carterae.1